MLATASLQVFETAYMILTKPQTPPINTVPKTDGDIAIVTPTRNPSVQWDDYVFHSLDSDISPKNQVNHPEPVASAFIPELPLEAGGGLSEVSPNLGTWQDDTPGRDSQDAYGGSQVWPWSPSMYSVSQSPRKEGPSSTPAKKVCPPNIFQYQAKSKY
ncbi:hypothetical protein VTN77DRAFT_2956 [Rasamsonia byssochlamydoides]|uniref:uncharacterized protein n=1 Tax=Rasamsonia byssochlamydoides TaxID=89139 RepID=UPI0037425FA1